MASAAFAPLRHRSFRFAITSSLISSVGTWMQTVAMGVYLQETTHNPVWLGLVTFGAWIPSLVAAPLGGAMADRLPRQRIIQTTNAILALDAIVLAALVLFWHLAPIVAVVLALIEGFASAASWTSWNSLLRDLVDESEVLAAVSLSSAQFNIGRVIGPIVAGSILAFASAGWCFAANAASFVFVVIIYAFVRTPPRSPVQHDEGIWSQIAHGARTAWSVPGCRNPIIAVGVIAFFVSPFITLVPHMAIDVLHAGKTGTSWLVTAQGLGAVVGSLAIPAFARRHSRVASMEASLIIVLVALGGYAVAPTLALSTIAIWFLGLGYLGVLTALNATVQIFAPAAERSRVLSLYTMSLSLTYPIGAVIQSIFVKPYGIRAVTLVATGAAAVLYIWVRTTRPGFLYAMHDAPTE